MKIAIYGYGNLGRGAELAVRQAEDAELFGIFTRRAPESLHSLTGARVYAAKEVFAYAGDIDVLLLCGGSATDLAEQTPSLAAHFDVVDSFDTHAKIPAHFERVHAAAASAGHLALICGGWDPGLFSLARLYGEAILPRGKTYTFWGRGVSAGHSDAIRRINGVEDARQYTVPIPEALEKARRGELPPSPPQAMHRRECFVAAKPGADKAAIEKEIREMPHYFAGYETTVRFIDRAEMEKSHSELPHGGSVIRTGQTGITAEHGQTAELRLTLASNPEFTAGVLVACARAVVRMHACGRVGAVTMFDLPPAFLSPLSPEKLRAELL